MNGSDPARWRISDTEAGLEWDSLFALGLNAPSVCDYRDFSASFTRGDNRQAVQGNATVEMLFENLSPKSAYELRSRVDAAQAAGTPIYLTIDTGDATAIGPHWVDLYGYPVREEGDFKQGQIRGRVGRAHYPSIRLFLNAVVVVNDPSLYTTE